MIGRVIKTKTVRIEQANDRMWPTWSNFGLSRLFIEKTLSSRDPNIMQV